MQEPRGPRGLDIAAAADDGAARPAGGGREVREHLNPGSGFFYGVEASIAAEKTPYQEAELVKSEALGKVLLLDGITQVSERWEYRYHELLVHPAMLAHPNPESVLVIGGGDGGALREVLAHKTVKRADMVELDEAVVRFSRENLPCVHRGAFDDPRSRLVIGDGRAFVEAARADYDVVVMDMTDPAGPSRFLYTEDFFRLVRAAMRGSESVFAMHGESPVARPAAYACIERTLRSVFPRVAAASTFVPMYATLWSFRYASAASDPSGLSADEVERRIAGRMSSRPLLANGPLWPAIFAADPILAEAASDPRGRVVTDGEPDFPDCFDPGTGVPA